MTAIEFEPPRRRSSRDEAVAVAGGWCGVRGAPEEHIPALIEAQPRALGYDNALIGSATSAVGFLRDLPDLEFLVLKFLPDDIEAINGLSKLRSLSLVEGWTGELRLDAFPDLEWFSYSETRRETSLASVLTGVHPSIRHLKLVKYPNTDLTPLAELFPNLTHLELGRSSKLESLRGLGAMTALTSFDLYHCAKLPSLDGIEQAVALDAVELAALSKVTDLSPLAALPAVRFLRIDLKTVESLAPLANHPTIEAMQVFSKVLDGDPSPVRQMPALRAFTGSLWRALGDDGPPRLSEVAGLEDAFIRAMNG